MKIAELNIGLNSKNRKRPETPETVLNELRIHGFRVITARVVASSSLDGAEDCLACKTELPENWQSSLTHIANLLGQDCIAVVGFVGHAPYDNFCADLWIRSEIPTK